MACLSSSFAGSRRFSSLARLWHLSEGGVDRTPCETLRAQPDEPVHRRAQRTCPLTRRGSGKGAPRPPRRGAPRALRREPSRVCLCSAAAALRCPSRSVFPAWTELTSFGSLAEREEAPLGIVSDETPRVPKLTDPARMYPPQSDQDNDVMNTERLPGRRRRDRLQRSLRLPGHEASREALAPAPHSPSRRPPFRPNGGRGGSARERRSRVDSTTRRRKRGFPRRAGAHPRTGAFLQSSESIIIEPILPSLE